MIRFASSRVYPLIASVGLVLTVYSVWVGLHWWPAWIAVALVAAPAAGALWMALRPTIEVSSSHLMIGPRAIAWPTIRRVDQTHWISPMVVYLTLVEGLRVRVLYAGRADRGRELLTLMQQRSTHALINGVPHSRIFGEAPPPEQTAQPAPRIRVVSPQDEAEIEKLFQSLKSGDRPGGDDQ
jgi:hypothetical protein